jgi:hypothetical protein
MIAEKFKIVPIASDIDLDAAAANDCDSINMENYHSATFIIGFQTIAGDAPFVALYTGATEGTKTTALPFRYAMAGAAQGTATAGSTTSCDVLAAWASTTAAAPTLEVDETAYSNFMLIVEVDASEMADGHNWLTMSFLDTDTGSTGNVQVHAILTPRFAENRSATALK